MAEYTITAADGKKYVVDAPEGLPPDLVRDDLNRQLRRQELRNRPAVAPAPIERTLMGQLGEGLRGIPRGAIGLLETAGVGASAMLPDEEEAFLREIISGAAQSAASPFQRKAGYEDSMAGTFGEALGSTVPFILTGGLPGVAARVASGVALGGSAGAGTARTRAEQAGATTEERAKATALGVLPGVAEMVVPGMIVGRLRKAVGPQLATNITSRLGRVAGAAGGEGLQEAASEIAQNMIAQGIYDPEQGVFTNTGESFGLGAGVGGLIAALVELGIRDRSAGGAPPPAVDPVDQAELAAQQQQAGDLFPEELEAATSDEQVVGAAMARQQAAEEEALAAEQDALEAAEMQGQEQPDMIDIDETRQIQDLFDDEELARMQQEEDAQLAAQEAARAETERARTVEEIATLDARSEAARAAESEEKRRQILLPIIESGRIADPTNLARAFSAELRRQGFANTVPTESELATIERAVGVQQAVTASETEQAANAAALQARQDAEQRAGAAPLERLIPERRAAAPVAPAVVSPQDQDRAEKARLNRERLDRTGRGLEGQLEIPVIPRAKGAAAQEPAQQGAPQQQDMFTPAQETDEAQLDLFAPRKAGAPAAPDQGTAPQQLAFDLTAALDAAGVPPQAPVRRRVNGMTLAQAKQELTNFAAAPGVAPEVSAAVTALVEQAAPVEAEVTTPTAPVEDAEAPVSQVPSYYMDSWKEATGLNEADIARYWKLSDDQRGWPERLMVKAQEVIGGGVISPTIEHIGDLTNRMGPKHDPGFSYAETKAKAEKYLKSLRSGYGFRREFEENLRSNAKFKNMAYEDHVAEVDAALKAYADAHAKLKTYNPIQTLARDAAVALGNKQFEKAAGLLEDMLSRMQTREQFFQEMKPGTEAAAPATTPAAVKPAKPAKPVVAKAEPVEEDQFDETDPFEETKAERAARRKEEKSQEGIREKIDNINRAIDADIERVTPIDISDAIEAVAESDPLFTDRPTKGAEKQWLKGLKKTDPERAVAVLNAIRSEKDIPPIELPDIVPTRKTSANQDSPSGTIEVDGNQRPTTNSKGQRIADTEEKIRAFYKWFGDSKVVDDQGRPLVLYRGINTPAEGALNAEAREGYAVFASPSPWVANTYANPGATSSDQVQGSLVPVYVKADALIEFPVTVSTYDGRRRFDMFEFDRRAKYLSPGQVLIVRKIVDVGPRARKELDPEYLYSYENDVYSWGKGTSVKSAIGNKGTFDPASPKINQAQDEASYSTDLSPYITDFDSAVAAIVKYASNPAQKEIAQKLAARLMQLKAAGFEFSLEITPEGYALRGARGLSAIDFSGLGEATTVKITLNHPSNGKQSGTGWVVVAHELAHAATQAQIKYAPRGTAAAKLNRLFDDVVAHFNQRVKEGNLTEFEKSIYNRGNNALQNSDELLAWGLTSEPMQRWLDSIKSKNGSFLSRLFDVVSSALGFSSNDTALSELMSVADGLLTETIDTYTEVANKQGQSFGKQENATGYPSWALSLALGKPIVWAEKDAALIQAQSIMGKKIYLVATPKGASRVDVGSYTGNLLPPARLKEVQAVAAGMQKTSANVDNTIQAAERALTDQSPAANNRFLNVQGAQLKSTSKPMKSKPVRDAVAKVMGTSAGSAAGNAARVVLTWGLPLPALNDYVQSYIRTKGPAYALFADVVKRYTETAVKFEGAMRQFTDGITAQITRMGDWKVANADKYAAMTDLYFGGSHKRVDLTKPESEYVGNPEKLTAYRKLKKQYDAIGPAGQAIYRQMRVIHNQQFKQISQQVFNRVYDATQDKAMATRIQNEFVKQMREKGPLEGYAPMLRPSGKHMLKYVGKDGEPAFEIFTNPNDQAARRQQLLEEGISDKDINPFIGGDLRAFDGVVPSSFLGQLVTTLKESKVEDGAAKTALIESVMALGVAMSPSNSVLERLASRKEVAGYIRDPFWAFQEGTIGLGRKLINMEYGAQLNKEVANMEATRKNIGNDATVASIVEDITKRAKYSANPSQSWWSNLFTTGTYGWTLGFNVSSAIVDLSSLVLVTGPYLTRTYGFAKTHRVMMAAAKDILGMGTSADVETLVTQGLEGAALQEVLQTLGTKDRDMVRRKTLPSVLNIDFNDPAQQKKYGYLKPLVDKVREAGHSERYSELAESAEFGESNALSKWSARMGFMMNASERFKREVGLKTAYDLALAEFGKNPTQAQREEAAQKAMDMSLLLNGGSTAVTGARFQQQDIARVAFMYRRFAALQMYLQTKTAYDATMNDDPDVKKAARAFAGYTMLTSAAMVGVKGMPMMGAVAGLWAMYGALFGEEDEDNSLDNFLRTHLDPILVEGIPNILTNANVAGRMEMTNLLIRDSNLPNDATLADIVAAHFGGPAYGSVSRAYRGAGLIAEGEIQRGVESMLPASFSNVFKSARFLTEGAIETMRGDAVTEISPFGALSQALGFAPADYARTMDFNVGDSNAERRIKTKRTGLYEAVYVAYRVGDTGGVAQAIEKIIEFNARYPEFGITSEGLRQSIKGRDNNTQKMIRGRLPDERMRGNTLERAEDWGF